MSIPLIEFKGISKRFPGVVALDNVSLKIEAGSCHALMGENGAGKSTLGKVLAGLYTPNEGEILIEGKPVHFHSPRDAMAVGIGTVHQEMLFCENLSVAENLCLGQTPSKASWVNFAEMYRRAKQALSAIGSDIDPSRTVGTLPISQQQIVQIASAVSRGARILVFDEPTSSLSFVEAERLFTLIKDLQARGVTCIYVSHHLDEIFRLCDIVSVLRDGKWVGTLPIGDLDHSKLVQMMIGRDLAEQPDDADHKTEFGEERLRITTLSSPGKFNGVSLSVRAGEIVGLAGLVGAGRTEISEAIFGIDPLATGDVFVSGKKAAIHHPTQAMELGIGLIPEDRKRRGLVLSMTSKQNISLPILSRIARLGWIQLREEQSIAASFFQRLRVKAPHTGVLAEGLSGGNQQKLVIAKWLAAQCKVLIVDEPTRGVDVGAKTEIHGLIRELADQGSAILLISSELPELLMLADRVIVMREGYAIKELPRTEATQESVLREMAGVS